MGLQDLTWQTILGAALVFLLFVDVYLKIMSARKE